MRGTSPVAAVVGDMAAALGSAGAGDGGTDTGVAAADGGVPVKLVENCKPSLEIRTTTS